jgi:hypothetical protein
MKAFLRATFASCIALLLLVTGACGEGSMGDGPVTTSVETQDAAGTQTGDFASGQQMTFVMNAHNTSEYPVTFSAPSCTTQASYVVVKQGTANAVAEGGSGGVVCPASSGETMSIQPGQTVTFDFNWNQMVTGNQLVQPGSYSVVAGLICSGPGSGYCMPNFSTSLSTDQLTQSYYRSGPVDFTIKP